MWSNWFGRKGRRGNAAIEFALSFSLLWACFAGVFQFGYTLFVYNGLNAAVAAGARYASRVDFDAPNHRFVTAVQNVVVTGSPDGGGTPLVPHLSTANVDVSWTLDSKGVPQTITVSIQRYTVNAVFTTFNFSNKPSLTVRYSGVYKT